MKNLYLFSTSCAIVLMISCSSSKSVSTNSTTSGKEATDKNDNLNLATDLVEYLRGFPELTITGSGSSANVSVRPMTSIPTDGEPLYVINGIPVNGGLHTANSLVIVSNIKSVNVLRRPGELAFYGIRGSNGVIDIKLKK